MGDVLNFTVGRGLAIAPDAVTNPIDLGRVVGTGGLNFCRVLHGENTITAERKGLPLRALLQQPPFFVRGRTSSGEVLHVP